MDDLVDFLKARLDEAEQDSQALLAREGQSLVVLRLARERLAEVEAKRLMLKPHEPEPTGYQDGRFIGFEQGDLMCAYCESLCHSHSGIMCDNPDAPWPCPTVRLLALPYAGHPDYRTEWQV